MHYYKVPAISYNLDTTGCFAVAKCQLYASRKRHGDLTWGGLAGLDSVSRFICLVGVAMKTRRNFPSPSTKKRLERTEEARLTEAPVWYALPDGCESDKMMTIPTMEPRMTAILLTGDAARNKVQVMPGGGYSTVKINLPANWDELMTAKGYRPLSTYCH